MYVYFHTWNDLRYGSRMDRGCSITLFTKYYTILLYTIKYTNSLQFYDKQKDRELGLTLK